MFKVYGSGIEIWAHLLSYAGDCFWCLPETITVRSRKGIPMTLL